MFSLSFLPVNIFEKLLPCFVKSTYSAWVYSGNRFFYRNMATVCVMSARKMSWNVSTWTWYNSIEFQPRIHEPSTEKSLISSASGNYFQSMKSRITGRPDLARPTPRPHPSLCGSKWVMLSVSQCQIHPADCHNRNGWIHLPFALALPQACHHSATQYEGGIQCRSFYFVKIIYIF